MKTDIKNPKDLFNLLTKDQKELQIEAIEYESPSGDWHARYIIILKDKSLTEITIEENGDLSIDDIENVAKGDVWIKKIYKFLSRNEESVLSIKNRAYIILSDALKEATKK